jgi:O-succinylbenzoic acid--CoA ligase
VRRPWLEADAPGAPALRVAGRSVSRGALASRADALAAWLAESGVRAGDVVAALLPNGLGFAALLHALDRAGAVLLPLNWRLAPAELAFVLGDARPRLLVHQAGPLSALAEQASRQAGGPAPTLLPEGLSAQGPPLRAAAGSAHAPFALLYTSGTTGRPKGALLSHANLAASTRASSEHLGAAADDRWLACLPFFHVGGLSILLRCARQRSPVVVQERFDAAALSRALDAEAITHVSLVPAMLVRLLEARGGEPAPAGLRVVLLGGGPTPAGLLERARGLGFPVAPTYGLTEAASQVATLPPAGAAPGRGLEPLPGVELRILAADGRAAAPRACGEILVRGPTVMRGYRGLPQETRRALRGGWLHTGDVGRIDARGDLHVLDRRSDLVVSGGENVYPAEVEAVLAQHPDVLEAGVAGVPDPEFGQRPAAWIVPRRGARPRPEALARFCRERLAAYKVPVRFACVEGLPRTASGKLQRHRLWPSPNSSA